MSVPLRAAGRRLAISWWKWRAQISGLRRVDRARLPSDILIHKIEPVPFTFDATRSTESKRYQFFIWNHKDRPVFFSDLAWHRWHYHDVPKMARAAAHFVGEHDFASFARPGHQRESTVRTVTEGCAPWLSQYSMRSGFNSASGGFLSAS